MATRHEVQSFDDFIKLVTDLEVQKNPIFVLITGSKNEQGVSWCPDCVQAHPFIEEAVKNDAAKNSHFITISVQRDFWKDPKCIFRTDPRFRLTCVPTLLGWPKTLERLEDQQCANPGLLKILLENDY